MILKSELEKVIDLQYKNLEKKEKGIARDKYKSINHKSSQVKIVSGIRRCGKSTLLHQIMDQQENCLYLNFEAPGLTGFGIHDFSKLDEIIHARNSTNLFFDEIQNVDQWERYIRKMHDEEYNIYLTGSNASMLSKELGTKLTGRYLLTELFPFNYNEYLAIKEKKPGKDSVLSYLKDGGFPEYLKDPDNEYLHRIYYDIIYRDIAVRHKIRHTESLKTLALYLITNANKKLSYNKIRNTFSIGSTNTVIDYISYFTDSYLFFILPKFDFSVRKQISNDRKIIAVDTGMSSVNSASFSEDTGRKLESIVYMHLRNSYRDLFYFSGKHECDYVIRKNADEFDLVQVCLELTPENIDREINGLLEAMEYLNCNSGTIVTLDQKDILQKNGIKIPVIPFYEFAVT